MSILLPVRWTEEAAAYVCSIEAIRFDNSIPSYILTGNADLESTYGNYLTLSVWFKVVSWPAATTDDVLLAQYINDWLSLRGASDGDIELEIFNAAESAAKRFQTTNQPVSLDTWHHVAVAWDTTSTGNQVYIDGVAATGTWDEDFTGSGLDAGPSGGGKIAIGARAGFFQDRNPDVCVSEFWATNESIDLETDLWLFRTTAGEAVDLGSDGSAPTGTQALLYMKTPPTAGVATDNAGSWSLGGGEWAPVSSPTACADAPVGCALQHRSEFRIINSFLWIFDTEFGSVPSGNIHLQNSSVARPRLKVDIINTDFSGGDMVLVGFGLQNPILDVSNVKWCNPVNSTLSGRNWSFQISPTYIRNDRTLDLALCSPATWTHTSDDAGYSVPTENTLHVGTGQTYSTVWAAYGDAVDGDNIILHPEGSPHDADEFFLNNIDKGVSFWGSTGDPNDVELRTTSNSNTRWLRWRLWARTDRSHICGIYHLTVHRTAGPTGAGVVGVFQ